MTTTVLLFIWLCYIKRFIQWIRQRDLIEHQADFNTLCDPYHTRHKSERSTALVSNTKAWCICLFCWVPHVNLAGGLRNLLHIKNGHIGCFVNQNQPAHQFPSWDDWQTFMSSHNPKTLFESLKGWKSCVSLLWASKSREDKDGRNEERGESEDGEGEGAVRMISVAAPTPMAATDFKAPQYEKLHSCSDRAGTISLWQCSLSHWKREVVWV